MVSPGCSTIREARWHTESDRVPSTGPSGGQRKVIHICFCLGRMICGGSTVASGRRYFARLARLASCLVLIIRHGLDRNVLVFAHVSRCLPSPMYGASNVDGPAHPQPLIHKAHWPFQELLILVIRGHRIRRLSIFRKARAWPPQ